MKNNWIKLLGLLLVSGSLLFTSCGSDDDIVIDTGDGSINVGDGLYLALTGADPSSSAQLSSEVVDADGLGETQERSGFVAGYMYLEAGDYNVVQVTSKEITATIGGTASAITDEGSACDLNEYSLVTTSEGGAAFNVAASGLYKVTHDQTTSELVLYKIEQPALIGDATEGGWSADTELDGSVTATGGSWTKEGAILRNGKWKVRFNCRWDLNRRIDPVGTLDPDNGYQLYTNFGGSAGDLTTGGGDIVQTEEGEYTIKMDWSPQSGWALTLDRTGDAPTISFDPNNFKFGIIGDATTGAWDSDQNMFHKEESGVHSWYAVVSLTDGEIKFRTNDTWDDFDLGGAIDALVAGGGNIPSPGPGTYYVVLSTADEGATWTATMDLGGWGVIGQGGPTAGWDNDSLMTLETMDSDTGITTWVVTGDFTTDEWKFRAGADWKLNLGGDLNALVVDDPNIALSAAGNYKVTLSFDGENFSATADLQ